jgi:hypothetical protein
VPRALLTALVLATCLVTLSTGAALKTGCSGDRPYWRSDPCYNDIEPLYVLRGIDVGTFPYVHARLSADPMRLILAEDDPNGIGYASTTTQLSVVCFIAT